MNSVSVLDWLGSRYDESKIDLAKKEAHTYLEKLLKVKNIPEIRGVEGMVARHISMLSPRLSTQNLNSLVELMGKQRGRWELLILSTLSSITVTPCSNLNAGEHVTRQDLSLVWDSCIKWHLVAPH